MAMNQPLQVIVISDSSEEEDDASTVIVVFDSSDKEEDVPTVIVISDASPTGGNLIPIKYASSSEDEDEANSRAFGATHKVRHKLFIVDESESGCQSSTVKDHCHVVPLMVAGLKTGTKNNLPRPPQETAHAY